jgi:hypothetical protein
MVASGTPIVEQALWLAAAHPTMAVIHILDTAMQGHHGQTIDFRVQDQGAASSGAFSDWLDPPSPFAELLRRAFGAHLPPQEIDFQSPAWEFDVIEAFADRYDIVPASSADLAGGLMDSGGTLRGPPSPASDRSYSPRGATY